MTEEIQRSLGNIEAKVDILLDQGKTFDTRISAVEKKVWWASGAAGAVGFLVANFAKFNFLKS
jgi:hypothetical protein